ncbi:hypothetical protein MASR2M17_15050 [Aminivibrio sp.]
MKKWLSLFVICLLLLAAGSAFAADKIVVRVAHTIAPDSHYNKGLEHLGQLLSEALERTDGASDIPLPPSSAPSGTPSKESPWEPWR